MSLITHLQQLRLLWGRGGKLGMARQWGGSTTGGGLGGVGGNFYLRGPTEAENVTALARPIMDQSSAKSL